MRYSSTILLLSFTSTNVFAHGVIDSVIGANGVTMPGLSVIDGTPRDCATPFCGAEADTSIIRDEGPPLGRTNGGGPVDAAKMVALFMGGSGSSSSSASSTAIQNRAVSNCNSTQPHSTLAYRDSATSSDATGTKTPQGTVESGVAAAAGVGSSAGLPTTADDGTLAMTFHQVNQDGAGPLSAMVDPTSGGTDASAFVPATVTQNVPGVGIGGLSLATTMDFPVKIQMPKGMVCQGTVAGVKGVCVAKLRNQALAGPFGGSVAFTQSPEAKKRAIAAELSRKRFARAARAVDGGDV